MRWGFSGSLELNSMARTAAPMGPELRRPGLPSCRRAWEAAHWSGNQFPSSFIVLDNTIDLLNPNSLRVESILTGWDMGKKKKPKQKDLKQNQELFM